MDEQTEGGIERLADWWMKRQTDRQRVQIAQRQRD